MIVPLDSWCVSPEYFGLFHKLGFPGGSVVKNSPANAGDTDSIPGLGPSPGEGNGNRLHCSYLKNSMDRVVWQAIVH